jgi:hypothetical protein
VKITARWYVPDREIDLAGCSEVVFGEGANCIRIWVRNGRVEVNGMRRLCTIHDVANQFAIVLADRVKP